MNQDVKALPVVAWANFRHSPPSYVPYRTREHAEAGVRQSEIAATQEGPYSVVALTPMSDAESALAELRAEVERLSARVRDLLDQRQESAEKHSAYHDRLMNHIEQLMSRADTAEARFERARGLLAELDSALRAGWQAGALPASVVSGDLARSTAAFLGEGK